MTELSWLIAIAALIGTWLNLQKDRRCFWIWSVTNGFWCIYDAWHGLYSQAFLFLLYFILAIVGGIKWRDLNAKKNHWCPDYSPKPGANGCCGECLNYDFDGCYCSMKSRR